MSKARTVGLLATLTGVDHAHLLAERLERGLVHRLVAWFADREALEGLLHMDKLFLAWASLDCQGTRRRVSEYAAANDHR